MLELFKLVASRFFYLFCVIYFPLFSEEINLKISIKNGTTGGIGKADSIKVIALIGGMIPVAEFKDKSGEFSLEKLVIPDNSPVLLQASYKNANYNKIIPPAPNFRNKLQEILVYDTTESSKDLEIKSLIQIVREEEEIRIFKIYLIQNISKPAKTFYNEKFPIEIYVPKDSTNLNASLTQGDSKMAIPLNLKEGIEGKVLDRAILPGSSELQISYSIAAPSLSNVEFNDKYLFEKEDSERIVFYRPKNMNVEIRDAIESIPIEEDLPEGVGAYRVKYSKQTIRIAVSGGKAISHNNPVKEGRKIVNGTIFTTWDKSLFGFLGVLGFLFSLSFLFVFKKKS